MEKFIKQFSFIALEFIIIKNIFLKNDYEM